MRQTNNTSAANMTTKKPTPSTYIPPNKRQLANNITASPRTEKREPKKEYQWNTPAAFPALPGPSLSSQRKNPVISFSSAVAKRIEADKEDIKKSDVEPGWVHIRKHNGVIQFKNGPVRVPYIDYSEQEDKFLCDKLYKYRLARQQFDQDMDVMRLGDLSDYYGEPTLVEIQEAYEEEEKYWANKKYDGSDESGGESD